MTCSAVTSVEIYSIGGIEPMHEDMEIPLRGHNQNVEVILHQYIGMNLDSAGLYASSNYL